MVVYFRHFDMSDVPKTQKAAVYDGYNLPVEVKEIPVPELGPDDILVKILYSGVCRTDVHAWQGDFPVPIKSPPIVGGHEGAGVVVKLGSNVSNWRIGDRAGVKWMNSSCLTCEYCKRGYETNCPNLVLSGYHRDGSFQQYAACKASEAAPIPESCDMKTVAPVMCAGLTVYKALKEADVKPGQIVAINGAGGGLGSMAIQYAKAMGMRVLAITSKEKERHCKELGAEWFVDAYGKTDVASEVQRLTNGGPHGVLNLATTPAAAETAVDYVRTRGTIVLVALPRDATVTLKVFWAILRSITVKGSHVGTRQDMDEALDFFARGLIKIPVEMQPLKNIASVFKRLINNEVQGRIVLDMWN
ncbi:unnamed protein product [Bursaphelenchus xylophilus]|uniref:alcohol dehydrogenase n=1 Tax=Bursaphelenchus xylophilus TaxID=6326 RepID=A0A1I7S997_BURXY|nr:unnamed protein product [Bursaphelenchus xylophilus]CAG9100461.1 unnamed protein product [Bursaphelenchus xylophilus]